MRAHHLALRAAALPETRGDAAKGTNRGVAVLGDRVFLVTDNAHLLALHRVTGQLLWERRSRPESSIPTTATLRRPLVVKDMVVAGVSGGDLGCTGFPLRVQGGDR